MVVEVASGTMLLQVPREPGARTDLTSGHDVFRLTSYEETLKQNELEDKTAQRWQLEAEIPEAKFEQFISETVAAADELTSRAALAIALKIKHEERKAESSNTEIPAGQEAELYPVPGPAARGGDYWDKTGRVFFTGGYGWGVAPNLSTVGLGREVEILGYLAGGELPEVITETAKAVLKGIKRGMEEKENARRDIEVKSSRTQRVIKSGGVRARLTSHAEHKPVDTRHLKAGKRLSIRAS